MASRSLALGDALVAALLVAVPLVHLAAAPYTKVEESFNMQAAHDILVYGIPVSDEPVARLAAAYDHFAFPGAVPRSFVGAVVLAGLCQPLVALVGFAHAQFLVRAVLAAFNVACLSAFARALAEAYGAAVARWWAVLVVAQFHLPFYASRTLPNMFAFGLVTLALAFLVPKRDRRIARVRRRQAIGLIVIATAVFRAELAILLAAVGLGLVAAGHATLRRLVPLVLVTLTGALVLSVPIDSYFWQKPVWPELSAFYFNAILGSSSNWGTSPWHYYFTSALPRLLLNPLALPLVALALALPGTRRQARDLVLPSLAYVAVYSLQPHKEARFVFYAVPPLTAAAALAANFVFSRRAKSPAYALGSLVLVLSVLASAAASAAMLVVSSLNYPGGDALAQLYALTAAASPPVTVHADVLTCMTGLTLFGLNRHGLPLALGGRLGGRHGAAPHPVLLVDRTEDALELARPAFWRTMDYALVEDPAQPLGNWRVLGVVHGYDGIEVLRPGADEPYAPAPGPRQPHRPLGLAGRVAAVRRAVRRATGGWWIGPRMTPRIHVMKRVKDAQPAAS